MARPVRSLTDPNRRRADRRGAVLHLTGLCQSAGVRALLVHHDANSLPGMVGYALTEQGVSTVAHQVCAEQASPVGSPDFPDPTSTDLVVLFGSRWSVYEERVAHWVEPELEFVRAADDAGVPVLGLCFGGQLLAAAFGGSVGPIAHPEIGWTEVSPVSVHDAGGPRIERGPWLQWHFDAFSVPDGAVALARSPAGPQAFRLRRNLGLQFHPEADRAVLEAWMDDDLDQLEAAGLDAAGMLDDTDRYAAAALGRARRLIEGFLVDVARFRGNENVF